MSESIPTASAPSMEELVARVKRLESSLARLRGDIAVEVRSRRVVVVDEEEHERVVLEVDNRFNTNAATVRLSPIGDVAADDTSIQLYASDPDGLGGDMGLVFWRGGNSVGALDSSADPGPLYLRATVEHDN